MATLKLLIETEEGESIAIREISDDQAAAMLDSYRDPVATRIVPSLALPSEDGLTQGELVEHLLGEMVTGIIATVGQIEAAKASRAVEPLSFTNPAAPPPDPGQEPDIEAPPAPLPETPTDQVPLPEPMPEQGED